jgi:hypothetical protein
MDLVYKMTWQISEKESILQEIKEQKRFMRYHEDKIKMEKMYIIKNQIKIVKLEQKLRDIK